MATGKLDTVDRLQWNHTANLMALLININRGKDSSPVKASQLHPYIRGPVSSAQPRPSMSRTAWAKGLPHTTIKAKRDG